MDQAVVDRLKDIQEHPERHRHDWNGLQACCFIKGAIHGNVLDAHSAIEPFGRNGGVVCDVNRGPCACGAWH